MALKKKRDKIIVKETALIGTFYRWSFRLEFDLETYLLHYSIIFCWHLAIQLSPWYFIFT